jgi:hypothetical protein
MGEGVLLGDICWRQALGDVLELENALEAVLELEWCVLDADVDV